jgi:hypothetical protein
MPELDVHRLLVALRRLPFPERLRLLRYAKETNAFVGLSPRARRVAKRFDLALVMERYEQKGGA